MILRHLSIAYLLSLSLYLMGMKEKNIRPYIHSFGSLYTLAHSSLYALVHSSDTLDRHLPTIISDVEYENYFERVCRKKDIRTLKNELPSNLKNCKNEFYNSLLLCTIQDDFPEGLKYCLDCNIDPNKGDHHNDTPLHEAVCKDDITFVEILLKHKDIDPNIKNDIGKTPLAVSLFSNNEEIPKLLIQDKRVDPNITSANVSSAKECSPLEIAARMRHEAAVELLLTRGADPNVIIKYPYDDQKFIKKSDAHLAVYEWTILFWAVSHSSPAIVKALILAGANTKVEKEFILNVEEREIKKIFTPYEFAQFIQEIPLFEKEQKQTQIEITQILAHANERSI